MRMDEWAVRKLSEADMPVTDEGVTMMLGTLEGAMTRVTLSVSDLGETLVQAASDALARLAGKDDR